MIKTVKDIVAEGSNQMNLRQRPGSPSPSPQQKGDQKYQDEVMPAGLQRAGDLAEDSLGKE